MSTEKPAEEWFRLEKAEELLHNLGYDWDEAEEDYL